MKTKLIKYLKELNKTNKDSFSFQVFENFKPENLTIPEILNRIATYSNLKADDYKEKKKGIEKSHKNLHFSFQNSSHFTLTNFSQL